MTYHKTNEEHLYSAQLDFSKANQGVDGELIYQQDSSTPQPSAMTIRQLQQDVKTACKLS